MANVLEIIEMLELGQEVIIPSSYQFVVMKEIENHHVGEIIINFEPHGEKHTKLTLLR